MTASTYTKSNYIYHYSDNTLFSIYLINNPRVALLRLARVKLDGVSSVVFETAPPLNYRR